MTTLDLGMERLGALADYIEKQVDPSRFNFARWCGRDWQGAPDLSCGTNACAIGWATTMPMFRELGLELVAKKFEETVLSVAVYYKGQDINYYHGEELAAAELFAIDLHVWRRLFIPADDWSDARDNGRLLDDATADEWVQHARGIIGELKANRARLAQDLDAIAAECDGEGILGSQPK